MADIVPCRLCDDMKGHEREVAVLADALGGGTIAVRHAEHILHQLWSHGMWIIDNGEHPKLMPRQTDIDFGQRASAPSTQTS